MQLSDRIANVIARCRAFYTARTPGHFLVKAHFPVSAPPIPPLYQFDLETQLADWLDYNLAAARPTWQAKQDLDDDTIPSLSPRFGIAEHSAWLGMDVRLQETTSLPTPLLRAKTDLDQLTLSETTRWFNYMRAGYEHLRRRQDGTFLLSVRGTMSPMDLANALRGDDLFTDFLLDPAFAHRLMRFCAEAIRWYYPRLRAWADPVADGHVFMFHDSWLGPDCLGHLTNDAAMLCAPRIYDEFGYPYERDLCAAYGCSLYHVHNQKLHFAPRVAQLPGLSLFEVSNDPKMPTTLDDLPRTLAATGSANLLLHATSDEVRARLRDLQTRNVFLDVDCRDHADAAEIIAFVRAHSA